MKLHTARINFASRVKVYARDGCNGSKVDNYWAKENRVNLKKNVLIINYNVCLCI